MSEKQMIQGQLYRAGITCVAPHERCVLEIVLVATSNEDVRTRLPWVFDMSGYDTFRIDWTVKEPSRCLVIREKYERTPENKADKDIKRAEGTSPLFQKTVVSKGKKYEVAAQSVLYAMNPDQARKKLSKRIDGGADNVIFTINEMVSESPYAMPRDVSVYERATFVRG